MNKEKLVLVDGHSILNRAFYGMPDLTNAAGLHTGAVFGFLNILFRILDEEKADYLTVAFDVHAPTFRHEAYPAGICAERTAFVKALSEGEREFRAIAIVGGKSRAAEDYSWPCGECRQFMREFCETDSFLVITALDETDYRVLTLGELLPESFGPDNLI